MKARQLFPILLIGGALLLLTWWLWSWPYYHLRFYEVGPGMKWAAAGVVPPLLLGLIWYGFRSDRTRSDFFGALSFAIFGGFFTIAALAGALQLVNAKAATAPPTVVRGTIVKHRAPTIRRRRNRALRPPTITVRLAEAGTELKLAVPQRADFDRYPTRTRFAEPLRRGRFGWWFSEQ